MDIEEIKACLDRNEKRLEKLILKSNLHFRASMTVDLGFIVSLIEQKEYKYLILNEVHLASDKVNEINITDSCSWLINKFNNSKERRLKMKV